MPSLYSKLVELDKLIDWYEENKPDAGKRIAISVTPKELHQILGIVPNVDSKGDPIYQNQLSYRDRVIYCYSTK